MTGRQGLGKSWGSSPLTRGKRAARSSRSGRWGLIPAHAGKTAGRGRSASRLGAHPRSRGENLLEGLNRGVGLGSSPLTRGKHIARVKLAPDRGLIPAHAGKTDGTLDRTLMIWAHPRSRGENINCTSHVVFSHGSSPLTRGKPLGRIRDARPMGLIPAHAGKTNALKGPRP